MLDCDLRFSRWQRVVTTILLSAVLVTGCTFGNKAQKTSLELQAFQSREFDTDYKIAFASVISVFQDLGYIIAEGDSETGLISAKSPVAQSFSLFLGRVMKHREATAFAENMPSGKVGVRLNFVDAQESSSGYGMKGSKSAPVHDPLVYQDAFEKIQKAIFVRTATM